MQVETESENGCVLVVEEALQDLSSLTDRRLGRNSRIALTARHRLHLYSSCCANLRYDPHTDARRGPDGGWPGVGIRLTFLANSCVGRMKWHSTRSVWCCVSWFEVLEGAQLRIWNLQGSLANRRLANTVGPDARHPQERPRRSRSGCFISSLHMDLANPSNQT
jgi:hypothetical protein